MNRDYKRGDVLIVEDDRDIREVFSEFLLSKGYQVRAASDGGEALAALGTALPTAILTDLNMPNMDGWAFLHALASEPRLSQIPIAIMTAEERFPAGYSVLRKPFPPEDLLAFLERAHRAALTFTAAPSEGIAEADEEL